MHLPSPLLLLLPLATLTTPILLPSAESCTTPSGDGTCLPTTACLTQGFSLPNHCPGPANIQCCVKTPCTTSSGSGICLNTADKCGGAFHPGACPGDSSIQCCITTTTTAPPPPTSGSGGPVVAAAVAEEGLPYVWGGGGCGGPSGGGFDCSGLTQYALCKSGHGEIPRTAQTQYQSGLGRHLPRAEAAAGDLIFWATNGDCAGQVDHVGIYMRPGWMVNAATTGTPVREQSIWISSGGLSICPDAVRFW